MTLLPSSPEAERALLSSFLIAPREVGRFCAEQRVDGAHFEVPAHTLLFNRLLEMWAAERPIDLVTVTQYLRDRKELDAVGGPGNVAELFTYLPTASNAAYYLGILKEKLLLRQVIAICQEYSIRSHQEQDDVPNILSEVQRRIAALGAQDGTKIPTMEENINEAIDTLQNRVSTDGGGSIISVGMDCFDTDVGPLERGNLVVIGGQTKSGKSILAGQIALNIALNGAPVLYISLEMSERELTLRWLASLARVETRMAKLWNEHEHARFGVARRTLTPLPLRIVTRRYRLSEVVAVCQQFASRPEGLAAIVFDYAQIVEGKAGSDRRQLEIAEISRTCKRLAGSLNVLFFLLTQLNDDGRSREARDIENDANLMVEVGHNKATGERGVKVVLARSAPSGQRLKLRIIAEHTRIEDAPDMIFDEEPAKKPATGKRRWDQ